MLGTRRTTHAWHDDGRWLLGCWALPYPELLPRTFTLLYVCWDEGRRPEPLEVQVSARAKLATPYPN